MCALRWAVAVLGAIALAASPGAAQDTGATVAFEQRVKAAYESIETAVVRIRTRADMEYTTLDSRSGLRSVIRRPLSAQGTAVIVGRTHVDGQWEYLLMTNHHVADVSNYVIQDGPVLRENRQNTIAVPTVPEESVLLMSEDDEDGIPVIEVSRHVQGDMTLMRTVGLQGDLAKFGDRIGYSTGEVRAGAYVVTSGFPSRGGKVFAVGRVLEVDRQHTLGLYHQDMIIDIPVEHGQSGSPVFMVEEVEDGEIRFTLIGLVHASENGETYVVPYELWANALDGHEGTMLERLVR